MEIPTHLKHLDLFVVWVVAMAVVLAAVVGTVLLGVGQPGDGVDVVTPRSVALLIAVIVAAVVAWRRAE